jgi:four helix bundle protein
MDNKILKLRIRHFVIRVIRMTEKLPFSQPTKIISDQVIRSSTSILANYSACTKAKSTRDFINKLKISEEEADETVTWLELIEELCLFPKEKTAQLKLEANEILAILVASLKTVKRNYQRSNLEQHKTL